MPVWNLHTTSLTFLGFMLLIFSKLWGYLKNKTKKFVILLEHSRRFWKLSLQVVQLVMELLRDLLFPTSIFLSFLFFPPFQDHCISLPVCVLAFGFYYFLSKFCAYPLYSIQTVYWSLTCAYEWPNLLYAGLCGVYLTW
jgi:hypothetical protein